MRCNLGVIILTAVAVLSLAACAGPNELIDVPAEDDYIAGFLWGLVHGFVLPFSFIGSLFTDNISIYEVHNTGSWYDFGFVLGMGLFSGSSTSSVSSSTSRVRSRKY